MNIDERFTEIADTVTETIGKWYFTVISLVLLAIWAMYGMLFLSHWFTSPTWNFPLNTITTVGEWFMEGLVLAAANRVERRNQELQRRHTEIQASQQVMLEKIERLIEREEAELQRLEIDLGQERTHP